MKFTLEHSYVETIQITKKKTKDETVYVYAGPNGQRLKFRSHPTRAFNWVIFPADGTDKSSNAAGLAIRNKIIDGFIKAIMAGEDGKTFTV